VFGVVVALALERGGSIGSQARGQPLHAPA